MITNFFGSILNLIFEGVSLVTMVGTLGLAIIVFTIVTRLLLTPLQIKSQLTTKIMSKVQPEMQALQKKYEGKKDQQSQMQQSQEMQALYKKYNINPLAGCLPLLIQLPLIYSLYAVLRQPSNHIKMLAELYNDMAIKIESTITNSSAIIADIIAEIPMNSTAQLELNRVGDNVTLSNYLSNFTTAQWELLISKVPELETVLETLLLQKNGLEYFVFNLIDTPAELVASGNLLAFIVPVLAGASTFIFSKISMAQNQQPQMPEGQENPAENMFKVMNVMMPVMMGFISYTVATGLALYWIAGNLIMMVQQLWVSKLVSKRVAEVEAQLEKERAEAKANKPKKKRKKTSTKSEPKDQKDNNNKPRKERSQPGQN
ncbi:MAG: hypothetical protein ATN35_02255 [Epulopiscium sp. Nele67-Bin004]|nr:MAG: hypothetical protein ATN35_02255 [Epulopiscium sp. Nele67-Bin004]